MWLRIGMRALLGIGVMSGSARIDLLLLDFVNMVCTRRVQVLFFSVIIVHRIEECHLRRQC